MDYTDLNAVNKADAPSNERPSATGRPYDPVSNTEDVYQDTDYSTGPQEVDVCVKGVVRVQELPTQLGALLSVAVADVVAGGRAVRVLPADPRRRLARLEIPAGKVLRLGTTQGSAQGEYAYRLNAPTAGPGILPLTASEEVWAIGDGSAFLVSVSNEQWQR